METLIRYYFKPKGTYPARIYILYGTWQKRNMRAMGIMNAPVLYDRRAGTMEVLELLDCGRLMAKQFEAHNMNYFIWLHIEDGISDSEIEGILYGIKPLWTAAFNKHLPVTEIRQTYDNQISHALAVSEKMP